MIVVEGSDGSGKSSLVQQLSRRLGLPIAPKASHSLEGPVNNLADWVDQDLLRWGQEGMKIYDRYPLISEPIYGPLLRGNAQHKFTDPWFRARVNTLRMMSLVIWCVPPLEQVIKNVDHNPEEQMDGVRSYIGGIWSSYAIAANSWTGRGMRYDYTDHKPEPRDTHLAGMVMNHLRSWKSL